MITNQHIFSTLKFRAGQWLPETAEILAKMVGITGFLGDMPPVRGITRTGGTMITVYIGELQLANGIN